MDGADRRDTDKTGRQSNPVLEIDYEYHARHLARFDISDEEKRTLIETLAKIALAFVELGFGIAPNRDLIEKAEENSGVLDGFCPQELADMLYSENNNPPDTNPDAARPTPPERTES